MKSLAVLIVRLSTLSLLCFFGVVHAYTVKPVDGLWGVDSEKNLAVGRAFVFETTSDIVVMTMYGYNASRAPTFYTAAGQLSASNRMSAPMSEPTGGTCLGCTPTSGQLLSSPGQVTFEFTTSTAGFVTLPGETRKAISKGLIAWTPTPASLLGAWIFTYVSASATFASSDLVAFSSAAAPTSASGSGLVLDPATRTGCEFQISGAAAGYILCVKINLAGTADKTILTKWWGHRMDGAWFAGSSTTSPSIFSSTRLVSTTTTSNVDTIKSDLVESQFATDARRAMRAALAEHTAAVLVP